MTKRIRNIETTLGVAFDANQVRSLEFSGGLNMSAYKAANQAVVSSADPVDDTDLWLELPAGPSRIRLYAALSVGAAAGGFRGQLRFDQGAVGTINAYGILVNAGGAASEGGVILTALNNIVSTGASQPLALYVDGTVNLTNAGVVKFQWAQVALNATATNVTAGSYFASTQLTP